MKVVRFAVTALSILATGGCRGHAPALSTAAADPALARAISSADSLINAAVGKLIPGAVFVVAKNGRVVHERAFGFAQLNDYQGGRLAAPRAMRASTMFDLASVTKVMATTMATMLLVDRDKIELDAPVYRYLPGFRGPHLDSITVRHLLSHSGGLVQWQPLYYHASNSAQTYAVIRDMPLQWGVGDARHYSDLGFMLLGYMIERVSGHCEGDPMLPCGTIHTVLPPQSFPTPPGVVQQTISAQTGLYGSGYTDWMLQSDIPQPNSGDNGNGNQNGTPTPNN